MMAKISLLSSLLLLASVAGTLATPSSSSPSSSPSASSPASAPAPTAPAPRSGACDAVKAESCALCDHLADPALGCGLATAAFAADTAVAAVNAAIGPDVGMYSVVPLGGGPLVAATGLDAPGGCRVVADMANEGASVGECRLVGGMAYAVVACPVGKIPVGLACVAVDADNNSTPVRGTTQAVLLHTAQCGFPAPFPAPFAAARPVIVMACQPVELRASALEAAGGAGAPVNKGAWPSGDGGLAALLARAGTGVGARADAATGAAPAAAAKRP